MLALIRVQIMLLLILMLEPPGSMPDGRVKTISDGLREHPGIGAAIFVTLVGVLSILHRYAAFRTLAALLVWVALAGFIGMLYYPNTQQNAHTMYATMTLVAPLLLQTQLLIEGKYSLLMGTVPAWLVLAAVGLSFVMWPEATGILEIVYVSLLWFSWSCFHKAGPGI